MIALRLDAIFYGASVLPVLSPMEPPQTGAVVRVCSQGDGQYRRTVISLSLTLTSQMN